MTKLMFGYTWTPTLVDPYLQTLSFAQLGLIHRMKDNYFRTREMPERPEEIAFFFNVDQSKIEDLWDRRTQIAWAHVRDYMNTILAEREDFVNEKAQAGNMSAEARKQSVSLEEAREILGDLMPIYEAFATYWSHKKITAEDCEMIKNLIESGKTTPEQIISAIVTIAKHTPSDKMQYMKAINVWLNGGGWMAKDSTKKGKLDQCNEDSRDSLLAKMVGGGK